MWDLFCIQFVFLCSQAGFFFSSLVTTKHFLWDLQYKLRWMVLSLTVYCRLFYSYMCFFSLEEKKNTKHITKEYDCYF